MIGKLSTVTLAALLLAGTANAAQFVTNGGFETTTKGGNFEFGAGAPDSSYANAVTGWTSASASAYNLLFNANTATTGNAVGSYDYTGKEKLWSFTANPTGGNKFVALDGDQSVSGPLTQQLAGLVVGQSYTLTFDWAAGQLQSRDGDTFEKLQYSVGNNVFTTQQLNVASHGFSGWKSVSTTFTYAGGNQLLSFLSIGGPAGLPPIALLDNVSLVNAAVPEPATWAMMIGGFGIVGGAMRRQRRDALATC